MTPHVLIVCEYPALNGGERSLLAALDEPMWSGWRFSFACPADGPLAKAVDLREWDRVPFTLREADGKRKPREQIANELRDLARQTGASLVHANSLAMARIIGPVFTSEPEACTGHLRDIIGLSKTALQDVGCCDRLVAVSEATRNFHVERGLDPTRCVVLHNGIDAERFRSKDEFTGEESRQSVRTEFNLPPRTMSVLSVGQIGLRKGLDTLITAFETVCRTDPRSHLLIVGERHSTKAETVAHHEQLRKQSANGPLAGRVHWLGRRTDVPRLMTACDLLAHPARQEPFGRVLLEAAACERAIIATDVGGTREMFPNGEAVLIPPDDPERLATELLRLIADEPSRLALGHAAGARVRSAFPVRRAAEGLRANWKTVLAETVSGSDRPE